MPDFSFATLFAAFYEKTMSLSRDLEAHLEERARDGSRLAILFAQIALFTATIFFWKTSLYAEHDSTGIITALSYSIVAVLVSNSSRLSPLPFIHKPCGFMVNFMANLLCLTLTIFLEESYEISLSSLGFALSIMVLLLILLVIIQPSTDLGLFGLPIGVISSVTRNLFRLKFPTWIVLVICLTSLAFRCWLEKHWLAVGHDRSRTTDGSAGGRKQICKSETIEQLTVWGFHVFWVYNLFRTNCRNYTSSSVIMGMPACLLIFNLWFGVALIPRVYYLFQTGPHLGGGPGGGGGGAIELSTSVDAGAGGGPGGGGGGGGAIELSTSVYAEAVAINLATDARAGAINVPTGAGAGAGPINVPTDHRRRGPVDKEGGAANAAKMVDMESRLSIDGPGTGNMNLGPGASGFNLGKPSGSITGNEGRITMKDPGAGSVNLGEGAGSINEGPGPRESASKHVGPGVGAITGGLDPSAGSSAINIGPGLRRRTQADKEGRPADEAI